MFNIIAKYRENFISMFISLFVTILVVGFIYDFFLFALAITVPFAAVLSFLAVAIMNAFESRPQRSSW